MLSINKQLQRLLVKGLLKLHKVVKIWFKSATIGSKEHIDKVMTDIQSQLWDAALDMFLPDIIYVRYPALVSLYQ